MITITHLFYTRFTHSSLNNIFYTTINNIIILFKNFLPLRFFLLFKCISLGLWGFPSGSEVKNPSAMQKPQETWVQSLGQGDPLEKAMATHSSILACRSPWTEEACGLQSMGSQELDMTYQVSHQNHQISTFTHSHS